MFSHIIKKFRQDNSLSQNEFISLLSKHHESFKSLDVVTLSRWERKVTTPHITRQNELLTLIGVNLLDVRGSDDLSDELNAISKKIEGDGYFQSANQDNIDVIRISYINSHLLGRYSHLLNLIMSYEENDFFDSYLNQGLSSKAIFEKIINEKMGELTLVLFHGQLLGHTLSINLLTLGHDLLWADKIENGHHHLIVSVKSSHILSILPTLGRELYQFFQNNSQGDFFCIYVKDQSSFEALYSMNFKYSAIENRENKKSGHLMKIDHQMIMDSKSLMGILSQYHQGISNV